MRLTTKIILGIILFVFVASIAFIVGFSFTDRGKYKDETKFFSVNQHSSMMLNLPSYSAICVDYDTCTFDEKSLPSNVFAFGDITILPARSDDQSHLLFFPKEMKNFINTKVENDTLFIIIDKFQLAKTIESKGKIGKPGAILDDVNFTIYVKNPNIENRIFSINTNIQKINSKFIKASGNGAVYISSCISEKMEILQNNITLSNCKIKQLNFALNKHRESELKIRNCQIDEENISSENTCSVQKSQLGNPKVLNWYPKNKKAKLNIELSGDSTQIVFK